MTARGEGNSRDIQSLHRAFDIIEVVGRSGELGVTEIAKRTTLPVSTVHNLLRTMAKRHYVMGDNGRYSLGPAVTVLTSQWDPVRSLARRVEPHVTRMIKDPSQIGFATMLVGDRARVIAYHRTPGGLTINEHHDDNAEPFAIASGRLLVAMTRVAEYDHFIDAAQDLEPTWTKRRWRDELRSISTTGVCVRHTPSLVASTLVVIAVPVWGPNSAVVCSLALGVATSQLSEDLVAHSTDALWEATHALSAEFGCLDLPLPKPDLRLPALRALVADVAG